MIGKVDFKIAGKQHTASVGDDGTVSCDHPNLLRTLQAMCKEHGLYHSPAHGPWGSRALAEFAELVGGKLTMRKRQGEPGTIY